MRLADIPTWAKLHNNHNDDCIRLSVSTVNHAYEISRVRQTEHSTGFSYFER